jgi:hypothetical protein
MSPPFALSFDLAEAVGRWVVWAFMSAVNSVIAGLGAAFGFVWDLLPGLPDPLSPPSGGVAGAVSWLLPLGAMIAVLAAAVAAWVTFLLCKVALKWVKAL